MRSLDVSGQLSVIKDRERHCLLIALIVLLMMEIICILPGPQKRGPSTPWTKTSPWGSRT